MFDRPNEHCPIIDFKIYKIEDAKTGNEIPKKTVAYILVDEFGLLTIKNFETELEPSKIYVKASSGTEKTPSWSSDQIENVGTLYIFPPKINMPPVFDPFIEPANIEYTGEESERYEVKFPKTVDPEGTAVTLSIISPLPPFVTFDSSNNKLIIDHSKGPILAGNYIIDVEIKDADNESTSWK